MKILYIYIYIYIMKI